MKKNALILSAFFGLSILCSTPKAQAITIDKKWLIAAGAAVLVILAILASKKGGHGHSHGGNSHDDGGYCDTSGNCYDSHGHPISKK